MKRPTEADLDRMRRMADELLACATGLELDFVLTGTGFSTVTRRAIVDVYRHGGLHGGIDRIVDGFR